MEVTWYNTWNRLERVIISVCIGRVSRRGSPLSCPPSPCGCGWAAPASPPRPSSSPRPAPRAAAAPRQNPPPWGEASSPGSKNTSALELFKSTFTHEYFHFSFFIHLFLWILHLQLHALPCLVSWLKINWPRYTKYDNKYKKYQLQLYYNYLHLYTYFVTSKYRKCTLLLFVLLWLESPTCRVRVGLLTG